MSTAAVAIYFRVSVFCHVCGMCMRVCVGTRRLMHIQCARVCLRMCVLQIFSGCWSLYLSVLCGCESTRCPWPVYGFWLWDESCLWLTEPSAVTVHIHYHNSPSHHCLSTYCRDTLWDGLKPIIMNRKTSSLGTLSRTHVIYTIADLSYSVPFHFVMPCVTLTHLDVCLHSKCFVRDEQCYWYVAGRGSLLRDQVIRHCNVTIGFTCNSQSWVKLALWRGLLILNSLLLFTTVNGWTKDKVNGGNGIYICTSAHFEVLIVPGTLIPKPLIFHIMWLNAAKCFQHKKTVTEPSVFVLPGG